MIQQSVDGKNNIHPFCLFALIPFMLKSECRLLKGVGAFSTNKPEPKERKREKMIIMILLLVILIILILLLFKCCSNRGITPPPSDSTSTTENKTLDFIPAEGEERITIPGYKGIYLAAGTNQQKVDFYNPESNNCLFKISLYLSNDYLLFESDLLKPGERLNDITINLKLEKGIYKNCVLVYQCYSMDGKTQLNSSNQTIEINSK